MQPTPEDMARDLEADLYLADVAAGPWRAAIRNAFAAATRRALAAEAEVERLRALAEGLAARVAVQAELLERRAEKED